jgi:histidine ammonia-lyase
MIALRTLADLNWDNVHAVAWGRERLEVDTALLAQVSDGRAQFEALIDAGVPCYGVTTGLGQLVGMELDVAAREQLANNILFARAAATGDPLPAPVARATLMLKLGNLLSGNDGATRALCEYIVARLNDGFTPWIPRLGHGMGADAVAHSHCFQTLIGEGSVMCSAGLRQSARDALRALRVAPYQPRDKEGLALISGLGASVAYAMHAHGEVEKWLCQALRIGVYTLEAMAVPRDSTDPLLTSLAQHGGTQRVMEAMAALLSDSCFEPHKLQAPVSIRVMPQVYGALHDALASLRATADASMRMFTDNPVMLDARLLSHGGFHDQHLLNEAERLALALQHAGTLGVRRLHRLMDPVHTGLSAQLAVRPGLDAGMVVVHKAAVELLARAKQLCMPVSLETGETSQGQEDYMSLIFPRLDTLLAQADCLQRVLAHELLAASVALDQRADGVSTATRTLHEAVRRRVPAYTRDRSPGPDADTVYRWLGDGGLCDIVG